MGVRDAWRALWVGEQKVSAAAGIVPAHSIGQAIWTPRNYEKFAQEGFQKNVIAFKAIQEVAKGAASVPWRLFKAGRGERTEIIDHPVLDLLRRPNMLQGGAEFFETVVGYYLIAGNSYIEAVSSGGANGKLPRELWSLRPDRMRVVASKRGLPEAYEYKIGEKKVRWEVDPRTGESLIRHLKTFNPLNDWYGMSPIEAAAISIDQRNQADAWNMSLLQNSARPSGAFVVKPDNDGKALLSDGQFERAKAQLDAEYQGTNNAGRPMLLEGGLDWKQMSMSPTDMDWLEAKHTSARDISSALGVPPQLLSIPGDNTYSNYQEARLALWEETIIPLLRNLRDEFNGWLVPMFGENMELDVDLDEVSALTLRREKKWKMVQEADFLTIDEKREAVGYDNYKPGEEPGGVILVPATLLPLGTEPEEDEPEPEDEEPDEDDKPDTEDEEDEDDGKMTPDRAEAANLLAYGDGKVRRPPTLKAV